MRGAVLWKRILNEGLDLSLHEKLFGYRQHDTALQHTIITSTIFVDRGQDFADYFDLSEFAGDKIAIPFERMWIEFSPSLSSLNGAMIGSADTARPDGDIAFVVLPIQAIDRHRPLVLPPCSLICGPDRSLRYCKDGYLVMRDKFGASSSSEDSPCNQVLGMLLGALRFLSCSNVSATPHDNDPKQVNRAIKRHGGTPDSYRYHTLVVRPPGSHKDSPAQEIGIMPRHVCRGHFAEYGPEFNKGLLFGKYSGRFYVPPHLKGDKKNGVVEKDYAIPAAV